MTTLHTQVMSELAASLERTVGVAAILTLLTVLVGGVTALHAKVVS